MGSFLSCIQFVVNVLLTTPTVVRGGNTAAQDSLYGHCSSTLLVYNMNESDREIEQQPLSIVITLLSSLVLQNNCPSPRAFSVQLRQAFATSWIGRRMVTPPNKYKRRPRLTQATKKKKKNACVYMAFTDESCQRFPVKQQACSKSNSHFQYEKDLHPQS